MGIQVHAIKLIDKTLEKFTTPNDEVQIIDWGNRSYDSTKIDRRDSKSVQQDKESDLL